MKHLDIIKGATLSVACMLLAGTASAQHSTRADEQAADGYYCVASFTPKTFSNNPQLYVSSTEKMNLYVGYANSEEKSKYTVSTDGLHIDNMTITPNNTISIYVDREELASQLRGFTLAGIKLKSIDASRLIGVDYFGVSESYINETQIQMPESDKLVTLALNNNEFEAYPYFDKYPNLRALGLPGNKLTEFDASRLPQLQSLNLAVNQISSVKFDNPLLTDMAINGNELTSMTFEGLPALEQIFLSNNHLTSLDPSGALGSLRVLDIVANNFTFANLPLPKDVPINVYYYANQYPIEVECIDREVNLSDQVEREGVATSFYWYVGVPTLNSDTGAIEGDQLAEGVDYTFENGVTTFLTTPKDDIMCVMLNPLAPRLIQYTQLLSVTSVQNITDEMKADMVNVYTLDGRKAGVKEDMQNLPGGFYIHAGKVIFK